MDVTATDLLGEDGSEEPLAPEPLAPAEDAPPPPQLIPYRGRRRRWLRRIAKTVAVFFIAGTFLSTAYNAATDGRASVPAGLTYVQAGVQALRLDDDEVIIKQLISF